jgi:sporulation protein YlmC with PRC-barrel domain
MKFAFATTSALALLLAMPALAQSPAKPAAPAAGTAAPGADIVVTQPPPAVTVQPATPDVTVKSEKPDVKVQQAPPEITINRAPPNVAVETGKPEVNVLPAEKPNVTVVPGGTASGVGVGSTAPATGAGATAAVTPTGPVAAAPIAADVKDIIGKNVYGADGKEIGEINNLLVDPQGRIRAVIVEFGGFLGIGENKVAVPWQKLTVGKDRIATDMTPDVIKTMPRWAKDRPGEFADATPFR